MCVLLIYCKNKQKIQTFLYCSAFSHFRCNNKVGMTSPNYFKLTGKKGETNDR
jgi:hypothetical protein